MGGLKNNRKFTYTVHRRQDGTSAAIQINHNETEDGNHHKLYVTGKAYFDIFCSNKAILEEFIQCMMKTQDELEPYPPLEQFLTKLATYTT